MTRSANMVKKAYVAKTRLSNYNASLQLEGYSAASVPAVSAEKRVAAKAALVLKYKQK